jgi:hypothetical protein
VERVAGGSTEDNKLNIADFTSFIFPLRPDGSFNKFGHMSTP